MHPVQKAPLITEFERVRYLSNKKKLVAIKASDVVPTNWLLRRGVMDVPIEYGSLGDGGASDSQASAAK